MLLPCHERPAAAQIDCGNTFAQSCQVVVGSLRVDLDAEAVGSHFSRPAKLGNFWEVPSLIGVIDWFHGSQGSC